MQSLRENAEAQARRLLRVLFLWLRAVPRARLIGVGQFALARIVPAERGRAVVLQAPKFLLPFLVVSDLATFVKLQHVRADALKQHRIVMLMARHPAVGCDETRQKTNA